MLAELLLDDEVNLILVRGGAGSGKTLLTCSAAIEMIENHAEYKYKKVTVSRPLVEMGNSLGYIPGDIKEKMEPWLMPIYDNLELYFKAKNKEDLQGILNKKEYLEIQVLSYIRGRTIPYQILIIDEAQNLTPSEVKAIITRAGVYTKVILTGDIEQIDGRFLDEINNGLTYATERLKGQHGVAVLKLEKTERSPLAELGVKYL